MNTRIMESSEVPEDLGEEKLNYYGYGFIFSLGVLIILIVITYTSYLCIRMRSRNNSTTTVTTTTAENGLIFIQQGLDEATLRSYPKLLYAHAKVHKGDLASSGCSICLTDYKDNDMLRLLPDCGHLFHLMCIDPWLRVHPTCPICRNSPLPSPLADQLLSSDIANLLPDYTTQDVIYSGDVRYFMEFRVTSSCKSLQRGWLRFINDRHITQGQVLHFQIMRQHPEYGLYFRVHMMPRTKGPFYDE